MSPANSVTVCARFANTGAGASCYDEFHIFRYHWTFATRDFPVCVAVAHDGVLSRSRLRFACALDAIAYVVSQRGAPQTWARPYSDSTWLTLRYAA